MEVSILVVYKKMYLRLFNYITDALELLTRGESMQAEELLKRAQTETEEIYSSAEDIE